MFFLRRYCSNRRTLGWGKLEYDFSRLDRFVDTVSQTGAMEWIEGSHVIERAGGYDGPVKIPAFEAQGGEVKPQQFDPDDPRAKNSTRIVSARLVCSFEGQGMAAEILATRAR